jgi:hypothetical protein
MAENLQAKESKVGEMEVRQGRHGTQEIQGQVCSYRPSRYVSVINDNHLVSLMNFIARKVNRGPYIKIHQQSEFKWSISED